MKIFHISDTHGGHKSIKVPLDIDTIVFSGDCANPRDRAINSNEVADFVEWFEALDIPNKIFVAGNHDTSIENKLYDPRNRGFHYLENEEVTIDGIKFWGSPYSPSFGIGWAFNKKREKLMDLWNTIPNDTDVIITHGPPRGILDLSDDMELCGCRSLLKVINRIRPQAVLFGHIHDNETVNNNGLLIRDGIQYSNGSMVDNRLDLVNEGNILEVWKL